MEGRIGDVDEHRKDKVGVEFKFWRVGRYLTYETP